jgi:hypothetical protein
MLCPMCGTELPPAESACPACGHPLLEEDQQPRPKARGKVVPFRPPSTPRGGKRGQERPDRKNPRRPGRPGRPPRSGQPQHRSLVRYVWVAILVIALVWPYLHF